MSSVENSAVRMDIDKRQIAGQDSTDSPTLQSSAEVVEESQVREHGLTDMKVLQGSSPRNLDGGWEMTTPEVVKIEFSRRRRTAQKAGIPTTSI